MKPLSEKQVDRIFQLHPRTPVHQNGKGLVFGQGNMQLTMAELQQALKQCEQVQWHLVEPIPDNPEITALELRLEARGDFQRPLMERIVHCRKRILNQMRIEHHHEDMHRFIKLWVWKLLLEDEYLLITAVDDEEEQQAQTQQMQRLLPTLILELDTLFAAVDFPMSFKEYRRLSGVIRAKLHEALEELDPKLQSYFQHRIADKRLWRQKKSLLMVVQKKTHQRR